MKVYNHLPEPGDEWKLTSSPNKVVLILACYQIESSFFVDIMSLDKRMIIHQIPMEEILDDYEFLENNKIIVQ